MRPKGRWMVNHKESRPHTVHTVVTIETSPRLAYEKVAEAAAEAQRRREHDVRAHWRTIRRGQPDEYRVKIKAHKRGDPEIGTVVHDHYQTTTIERL